MGDSRCSYCSALLDFWSESNVVRLQSVDGTESMWLVSTMFGNA